MSRSEIIGRLLAELYDRQRAPATSQNKSLTKSLFPIDAVALADETTQTLKTPPFKYAPVTTGTKLVIGQGQYR